MTDDSSFYFRRDPEPALNYGDYPRKYLLQVDDPLQPDLQLLMGNAIGRGNNGEPIVLDSYDIRLYGNSFTASYGPDLQWRGRFERRKVKPDQFFHCFAMSILTSRRIKEIIEQENIPNIEFIPMRVFYKQTDEFMADMWVINVFNWKNVFDYAQSDVIYNEHPFGEMLEDRISSRFGDKRIIDWNYLKANIDETKDGLFLAKGPSVRIWQRPFISKSLADKIVAEINSSLNVRQKITFARFSLNRLRDRECSFHERSSEYCYAGWTPVSAGDWQ